VVAVGAKRLRHFMQRDGTVPNRVLRIFLQVIAFRQLRFFRIWDTAVTSSQKPVSYLA
jgi:hypothetical protein